MSAKRKHRTPNAYLKYLKGALSREEQHSFERDLQADPFALEAMEGMEQLSATELEEDILSLHSTLRKRLQRRRRRTFYYAAASIASLLIVGTVFLNIYNINPKTAEETIPKDESFLHESPVPEEGPVIQAEEEAPVPEEIVVQEKQAQPAAEMAPESEKAEEKHFDAIVIAEEEVSREEPLAEAPVPVTEANDFVVVEAQPMRAQKKGRSLESLESPAALTDLRVSGIVISSEDLKPLPGASISIKGSDSGQVADREGRFSLVTNQREQTTVIASYVGMETEEFQLSGGRENQVVLDPDPATLNEVIVIGHEAGKSVVPGGGGQRITVDKEISNYSGAEPEVGLDAYKLYIEEQIRFPAGDTFSNRELVVMRFNVDAEGTISHIESLRSPGQAFTEEATRLLLEGPGWNPARNESGPTDDVVRMRIVFKK